MNATVIKTNDLPESYSDINPHNLYLYCKSYMSGIRANTAHTKTRSDVRGGGKKPWAQKGGGRARAGSVRSPIFVGGGVAFGPKNNRNYNQKVNRKQKKLALNFALAEVVANEKLFVVDNVNIESGKTKDAKAFIDSFEQRDVLVVSELIDDATLRAFENLQNAYIIESNELNAYLAAAYHSLVIEKSVWEKLIKEN